MRIDEDIIVEGYSLGNIKYRKEYMDMAYASCQENFEHIEYP